ncbi:MurR/RpiR family transcriptional regulator [Luteimonas sp. JM171]|uniref:MurR/RpiR family transcriptional regulator n=1 Tax=Luteimonas sp. JM171 TaxID=1896164 RepID=UPI000858AE4B|nr:MurR/RpiR family transcriptional regulator [Luteimonas sp. JM171]AOH36503.1 transcriptional regulator [Luteimonas sp. JM171]
MSSLLRISAQRDRMSAIERRIADFILDNAHLLRDYSSQQLANALEVSQSSVVKFSQKLGFKGYPDLKYAIGEDLVRQDGNGLPAEESLPGSDVLTPGELLWQAKSDAVRETRLLNPPERIEAVVEALRAARTVFVIGLGQDGIVARAFTLRLAQLGILAVYHFDPVLMPTSLANAGREDVMLVFSEHGRRTVLSELSRLFRTRVGTVVSVTRNTPNPLRAQADLALVVSGHDDRPHVEPLLYHAALQQLLDLVFVLLCEHGEERLQLLDQDAARIRQLLES